MSNRSDVRLCLIDLCLACLAGFIVINRYFIQDVYGFSFQFHEFLIAAAAYVALRLLTFKTYPWLFVAFIVWAMAEAAYGILQLYGVLPSNHSGFALTGSFFNPGPYAGFLAAVLPAALGVWLYRESLVPRSTRQTADSASGTHAHQPEPPGVHLFTDLRKRFPSLTSSLLPYGSLAGLVMIGLVLPATRSRAGILAVIISACYLIFVCFDGRNVLKRWVDTTVKRAGVLAVAAVFATVGFYSLAEMNRDSADGRLLIWQSTLLMIQENPWAGVGFDRFKADYMKAQASWFESNPGTHYEPLADNTRYAFNDILQFTAEQGLIGLALLMALGVLIIRTTDTTNAAWLTISKAGIMAIVVFGLFSYPSQIMAIKICFVFYLAVVASFSRGYRIPLPSLPPWARWSAKSLLLALVLLGAVKGGVYLYEIEKASEQWGTALSIYTSGSYEQSIADYETVYPVFNRNGEFLTNYGKALSMAGSHEKAIEVLKQAERHRDNLVVQTAMGDSYKGLGRYEEAEQAYLAAAAMLPDRLYPGYLLVQLYDETGQREKLIPLARELLVREPKIESMAVSEIKAEVQSILDRVGEPDNAPSR